jgi:MFS family permease
MRCYGARGHPAGVTLFSERSAAFAVFFAAGWLPAAWSTRVPAIKADLDLTEGALAVGILGLEAGAIVGLPVGAVLVARLGGRRALRIGFAGFAPALVAVGCARNLAVLAAALAAMALANSVADVAMNAHGVELERRVGRPLLSGLHAGHPLGLVAGGLVGTAAAAAELPVAMHFAIVGAVGAGLAGVATGRLAKEHRPARRSVSRRPSRRLLVLGLLAFCAFALDGAAANWSAVSLQIAHQAPGVGAAAFTGFALALALGRLFGDRLVARVSRARVVQVGAIVCGAGGAVVVFGPGAGLALVGWALFGLGLATVAPTLLGAAPRAGDAPPAAAIAAVTTVGYLGSFSGPPLIGLLAQASSLSSALLLLVALAAALGLLARPALGSAR